MGGRIETSKKTLGTNSHGGDRKTVKSVVS
jgi:hypothetical protein